LSILYQTYRNKSDLDLILLYQKKQNRRIMNELFRRNQYLIRTVCWKYLQKDDCEDVASEVFVKLLNQIKKEIPKNISAWIYTVSKNTCLLRIRNNIITVNIDDIKLESDSNVYSENKEVLLIQIEEALEQLKEEQKNCVKLFYLKEMTYDEISKKTKKSIQSVKSCLQNGKRNIQIYIDRNLKKKKL